MEAGILIVAPMEMNWKLGIRHALGPAVFLGSGLAHDLPHPLYHCNVEAPSLNPIPESLSKPAKPKKCMRPQAHAQVAFAPFEGRAGSGTGIRFLGLAVVGGCKQRRLQNLADLKVAF